ncbi:MAG: DivIVA domain-containing protein [Marmoricola sp.]|nr:DivIVA domain-containing protein [Marmoricola sp.]
MSWFFAVLIVLAIGGVAAVAAGRGAGLGQAYDDRADVRLPADRPVTGADLRALRFNTAVRGYRASEVDALIDRLAAQLDGQLDGDDQHRGETPRHGAGED